MTVHYSETVHERQITESELVPWLGRKSEVRIAFVTESDEKHDALS